MDPSIDVSQDSSMVQRDLQVAFDPKPPVQCLYSAKYAGDLEWTKTALIFTHGAGGTLQSEAIVNFTQGFISLTTRPTILCFQGNMNLQSRVKMFAAVNEARKTQLGQESKISPACLGGRSMGARAAVMAAAEETTHLVLVSYSLHTDKEVRDKILLNLPVSVKIIFVSGDNDSMCDLGRLEAVRRKMKCQTWRIVVQGADHGMNVKPKAGTQEIGRMTGALVATWLDSSNERLTEGSVSWDSHKAVAQWSGWSEAKNSPKTASNARKSGIASTKSAKPTKPTKRSSGRESRRDPGGEQDDKALEAPKPKRRRRTYSSWSPRSLRG